jgi:hypothetical protein
MKRRRREADPHLVPTSRILELYLHAPKRRLGMVLNYLSTGTTSVYRYCVLFPALLLFNISVDYITELYHNHMLI